MKNWRNIFHTLAVVLAIGGALTAISFYALIYRPITVFRDVQSNPNTTPGELRQAAHRILRWRSDHDAFIVLSRVGDVSSVPLLIRWLPQLPADNAAVECTTAHCREALVAITHEDFGYRPDKWRAWQGNQRSEQAGGGKRE